MNLFTIVGARPQFIKAASLSRAFADTLRTQNPIYEQIIHTGQHYDKSMSDQFFLELDIPEPSHLLGIGGGTHGENTGRMIEKIEAIFIEENPDIALVYGDTDSTLAGALAATKLKIPVVHVESGLRSFNREQPEEINRVLTDHISQVCFAPSTLAVTNLLNEGIGNERIVRTGDLTADAVRLFGGKAEAQGHKIFEETRLQNCIFQQHSFVLATIHRAENVDNFFRLRAILQALCHVASNGLGKYSSISVVMPMHPRTKKKIFNYNLEKYLSNFLVTPPLSYMQMLLLQRRARLIVTDSGGIQKEAYLSKTPCVTVRTETEWVELLQTSWNQLAHPKNSTDIITVMEQQIELGTSSPHELLYGDGQAARYIAACLQKF